MKTIETILREEMYQLKKIVEEAERRLETAPKGHLRIIKKRGGAEYYYKGGDNIDNNSEAVNNRAFAKNRGATTNEVFVSSSDGANRSGGVSSSNGANRSGGVSSSNGANRSGGVSSSNGANHSDGVSSSIPAKGRNRNGRYIKKHELKFARELAQKGYDVHMVKLAKERVKAIDTFLEEYEKTSLKGMYHKINIFRRDLISAPVISDEEFVRQWQAVEYGGKPFADDAQEIITERGERVRSKSEKIIADKLYALGIPYRYECPVILNGNIRVYPDFTILRVSTREEVFLEHLGMMDDSDYVDKTMYKLSTYEKNGIYLGVNLFVTHETKKFPLNTRALDDLVRKLFVSV